MQLDARNRLFALERNPWTPEGELQHALFLRGVIISAAGYTEMSLTELAIRASRLPVYAAQRAKYPYLLKSRIKFLRDAIAVPQGPLSAYSSLSLRFLDRFEAMKEFRDMLAHAKLKVLHDFWTFEEFKLEAGDRLIRRVSAPFTHERLLYLARRAARISRLSQRGLDFFGPLLPPLEPQDTASDA